MKDIKNLIDNNKYQVFLMTCHCNLPAAFASHNWFAINKKGIIERWESGYTEDYGEQSWGYLRKNTMHCTPFDGITIIPMMGKFFRWKGKLIGFIEEDSNSLAKRMIDFIENSPNTYPYPSKFSLFGPNSNTYPQWILDHFPDSGLSLPWNAVGKNYKF